MKQTCSEWLKDFLKDQSYFSWYVRSKARQAGYTNFQLDYARRKLGVVSYGHSTDYYGTSWELPDE